MIWLKKVILFILSALFMVLTSCEGIHSKKESKLKTDSIDDLIDDLFKEVQNWDEHTVKYIDSLGFEISQLDSLITFIPYENECENNSFIFIAKNRKAFRSFNQNRFLTKSENSSYFVWRKKINDLKILDLSIEPHPTLNWLFLIRLRAQE